MADIINPLSDIGEVWDGFARCETPEDSHALAGLYLARALGDRLGDQAALDLVLRHDSDVRAAWLAITEKS